MTSSRAYYNEFDPYAAAWLRNLIAAGHIAPGDVDERSIVDVQPDDLIGYTQCHFFAGIGGWSLAARLAGWPDDRELWSGSEPCQPYSVAGKGLGERDERYLRPHVHRLISARRPSVYLGEQVAAAAGRNWLDRVHSDMEGIGYTCRSVVIPACAVDAPHRRDRLWLVADTDPQRSAPGISGSVAGEAGFAGEPDHGGGEGILADAKSFGRGQGAANAGGVSERVAAQGSAGRLAFCDDGAVANANEPGESEKREQRSGQLSRSRSNSRGSAWAGADWLTGADGKARRFEPSIRLLAHGVPARVGKLRAYGNAIVPQVAAEVIGAYLDIKGLAA